MGVDIYGVKPALTGEKPPFPDNYSELSLEERTAYNEAFSRWESENPGFYFRNNWWHWRPLQILIDYFNQTHEINIPQDEIDSLGSNDGKGVTDPEHCLKLAEAFNAYASSIEAAGHNTINLNMSHWYYKTVNEKGNVVSVPVNDQDTIKRLNDKYDTIFFGEAELDGISYQTSHGTTTENMRDFALFLQTCNGFEVH